MVVCFSCKNEAPTSVEQREKEDAITYTIDLQNSRDYADLSDYLKVTEYELPKANFGDIQTVISLSNDRLLVGERWNGRITLLKDGEIVWQRKSGEGPGDFNSYYKLYYDKNEDEIIVCEDFRQIFYNTSGEYLRVANPKVTYNDLAIMREATWYSSTGHDNRHMSKDESVQAELFAFTDDEGKGFLPTPVDIKQTVPFTDNANFFSIDNMTFLFNQDFNDTVYQLDSLGEWIAPDHVIRFKDRGSTQQILANEKPPSLARFVADEQLPYLKFSTPLRDNVHLTIYYSGREYRIFLQDQVTVMNAKKIVINDELYDVPYLHDNGTFAYRTTKEEHRILQGLLQPETTYAQWRDQHSNWKINRNDDERIHLIVLSPK
jgi:hypothetical protein